VGPAATKRTLTTENGRFLEKTALWWHRGRFLTASASMRRVRSSEAGVHRQFCATKADRMNALPQHWSNTASWQPSATVMRRAASIPRDWSSGRVDAAKSCWHSSIWTYSQRHPILMPGMSYEATVSCFGLSESCERRGFRGAKMIVCRLIGTNLWLNQQATQADW